MEEDTMEEDTNNTANGPASAPSEGGGTPAPKTYTEAEYNALQSSLDAVNKQLAEANNTIKSYTDMDIDGIKKSAEDWKQKAEKLEAEQKAQEFSSKLDKFVQAQGMRNDNTAQCRGVFIKCSRGCKEEFEIKIINGKQVH